MSDSDDSYGPPLPPGIASQNRETSSDDEESYGPSLPPEKDNKVAGRNISQPSFGPALPPHLVNTCRQTSENNDRYISQPSIGPALPSHLVKANRQTSDNNDRNISQSSIGPALPPHLVKTNRQTSDNNDRNISQPSIGPALPPHLINTQRQTSDNNETEDSEMSDRSIGPILPPHLSKNRSIASSAESTDSSRVYGPVLPGYQDDNDDSSDNEPLVGPSISMKTSGQESSAIEDFESRAQKMRDKLTGKDDGKEEPVERETWMTELPPEMGTNFGLTNRTFRKNSAPTGDRSGWTDTPADKERKEREGHKRKREKEEGYIPSEKDIQTAKEIEAYNKAKRPESLLEMHQKKRKKKKKKEKEKGKEKSKERRPFDRDLDLQVNRLDEAQRKAIIKRSQELGSRFKSGGTGTSFL